MSQLTDRLERDLREIAAGADPSPSAWASIAARLDDDGATEVALLPAPSPGRSKRGTWILAAAAAVAVIIGSIAVLTNDGKDGSTSTTDPNPTTTFVSPRNGFSVDVPEGSTVTPATQLWGASREVDDGFDVIETGAGAVFKGAWTEFGSEFEPSEVVDDERIDAHIDEYYDVFPDGCGVPRRQQADITIDGQQGRLAECPGRIEATVVVPRIETTVAVPRRLYFFTLLGGGSDARADFDALAASIRLTPETAVTDPVITLTSTFVSPTYGYSMGYLDRGGLAPATERWDPVPGQFEDNQIDERFDFVETGLGAVFGAASTEIPAGVSIDDWVDSLDLKLTVEAGGQSESAWERCYVPRREQEEITIDGRPGRILVCGQTTATVVAGGRLYLFTLVGGGTDSRGLFDRWVATIELTPGTAAVS